MAKVLPTWREAYEAGGTWGGPAGSWSEPTRPRQTYVVDHYVCLCMSIARKVGGQTLFRFPAGTPVMPYRLDELQVTSRRARASMPLHEVILCTNDFRVESRCPLTLLRRLSQESNVPLVGVARRVIETRR
ncbi:MAG: hypothetical protein JST91_06300 [Actinobacteria bacterium]|nr:hypothetical protein [Actinomycetota bacterium]